MAWFYLYETASGRLVSESSSDPGGQPGRSVLSVPTRAADTTMWDETTRTFVARPIKVVGNRIDDMLADAEMPNMPGGQLAALRRVIIRHIQAGTIVYNLNFPDKQGTL